MFTWKNSILLFIFCISNITLVGMHNKVGSENKCSVNINDEKLEELFLSIISQGMAEEVQDLLDQGLHPNNTLKVMPKFWEAVIERMNHDKENALQIIRVLLNYAMKSLTPNSLHDDSDKKGYY